MSQFIYMKCWNINRFISSISVIYEIKFRQVNFYQLVFDKSRHINHISYYTYFCFYEKYGPEIFQLVVLEVFTGLSIFQLAEKEADCVKNNYALIKMNQINGYIVLITLKTGVEGRGWMVKMT